MIATKTDILRPRKRRKKGSLAQLRGVLWGSLLELETLTECGDSDTKIKAANSLAALSRAYLACLETADIEQRLQAIEERIGAVQSANENGRSHHAIPR